MGCAGSNMGGVATARANEVVMPIPERIRPLLWRRYEEIKKRRLGSTLKGSKRLSKRELLPHRSSEYGEETEDNDSSLKSSVKGISGPSLPDRQVEKKKEVIYEKILSRNDVKEVKEEEKVLKKQEQNHHHVDNINVKNEENDGINNHDHDDAINVKNESHNGNNHDETIDVKNKGDEDIDQDDNDVDRERLLCHGSPSFRVYCEDVTSDDNKEKDGKDTRKSKEPKSANVKPKEEKSIVKDDKRERKKSRFGMGLPRKCLANVTAPCSGRGCKGKTQSRHEQVKSSQ